MDEGIGGEERRQKSTVTRREPDNTMTSAFSCKQLGSAWPRSFLRFVSRLVKVRTASDLQAFRVPFSVPSFAFKSVQFIVGSIVVLAVKDATIISWSSVQNLAVHIFDAG